MPTQPANPIYCPRLAPESPAVAALRTSHGDIALRNGIVIRTSNWLGDSVMALPAAWAARCLLPDNRQLAVLCPSALAPIWRAAPWIDRVIPFEGKRVRGHSAAEVRAFGAGAALVFPNSFGSALDVTFRGIPVRVGRGGRGRRLLLTHVLSPWQPGERASEYHQLSHYLDIVSVLGVAPRDAQCPPLSVDDSAQYTRTLGIAEGSRLLVVAPGAAYGPAKQWAPERFAAVAAWWIGNGGSAVVVGTVGQRALGNQVIAGGGTDGMLNLCGQTDLRELMVLLSAATACVSNDSGTMHLAAALGVSGVALFGSTNPAATGPLGAPWVVLRHPIPCSPCFDRVCRRNPADEYACLARLTPSDVCQALTRLGG